jgi:hypothetical protein
MAFFALFTLGYIVGVWTACVVFRQRQRAYEQAVVSSSSRQPLIVPAAFDTTVTRL